MQQAGSKLSLSDIAKRPGVFTQPIPIGDILER